MIIIEAKLSGRLVSQLDQSDDIIRNGGADLLAGQPCLTSLTGICLGF
ncbi:hypothetical protein ES707_13470 [subsurface metagenome]